MQHAAGGWAITLVWGFGMLVVSAEANAGEQAAQQRIPAHVTRYDLATRDDLLYARLLAPLVASDEPAQWPLLAGLQKQLGNWIGDFVTATRIANTITQSLPVEGQPPLRKIDRLVAECAEILQLPKPQVYVRNSPFTTAYVTTVGETNVLVLTSGLLRLYDGKPEELRFIVGRELGHLKCEHVRLKRASYGLLATIQTINLAVVPDEYQAVLPPLALGQLFSWARESEISADRAGLLCCQDLDVAAQALLRLLHGLEAQSSWIDPAAEEFDAERVVREFRRWQDEPFVDFVMALKRSTLQAPFIPERLAALTLWADSDAYRGLLSRRESEHSEQLVVVRKIALDGLASPDDPVNPYVIAYDNRQTFFKTTTVSQAAAVTWRKIDRTRRLADGQPLFFEIWHQRRFRSDQLLGGFVISPRPGQTVYTTAILWDWKDRSSTSRTGVAQVTVDFRSPAE